MPTNPDFPHLQFTLQGIYDPMFQGGPRENKEIDANRADPKGHAKRIRAIFGRMRQSDEELRRLRAEMGLPAIPADRGFLLRLPEGVDVDPLVRALGRPSWISFPMSRKCCSSNQPAISSVSAMVIRRTPA